MRFEKFPRSKDDSMGRPLRVEEARLRGDTAALSKMGRAGAEAANANRARANVEKEMLATKIAEEIAETGDEHFQRGVAGNEHIVPFDADAA